MRPVLFAFIGMMLYALQSVVLEQKLSRYSTAGVLLCFYLAMLPLTLVWLAQMKLAGQPIMVPSGKMFLLAAAVGAMYFFADGFYIGAYTSGGSVFVITTVAVLFPVLASVIRYVWVGGSPNVYQVIGYFLAVAAVFLVAKGSTAVQ